MPSEASEEFYKAKTFRESVILKKKKHQLIMCQNDRDKVRMMQKMEGLRMVWQGVHILSMDLAHHHGEKLRIWRRKLLGPQWDRVERRDTVELRA